MATDLAINYVTGDLLLSPSSDVDLRTGPETVKQRIRVRLRIVQGEWALDPTNGELGSRLKEMFRLPIYQSATELELVIREALEPMDDIHVRAVDITPDKLNSRQLNIVIAYIVNEEDTEESDVQTVETNVLTAG